MANLSFRSATTATTDQSGTASTIVLTKPTGAAQNDLLDATFVTFVASPSAAPTHTLPSGWSSAVTGTFTLFGGAYNGRVTRAYKIAGASEPANYTFTASANCILTIDGRAYDNPNTSNPVDVTSAVTQQSADTFYPFPTVTTSSANTLLTAACLSDGTNGSLVTWTSSDFTERNDALSLWQGDVIQASAGSSGSKSATGSIVGTGFTVVVAYNSETGAGDTPLVVTSGSLSLTGQDIVLNVGGNVGLTVDNGAISLNGQDVTLTAGSSVVIPVTNATITGQGQDVLFTVESPWTEGALTLTGSSVTLVAATSVTLAVTEGALTLAGSDVTLLADFDYTLTVDNGTVTLTGQDVTFAVGAGSTTVTVDTGSLTLTGQDVGISPSFTISSSGSPRRKRHRGLRRLLNIGR